MVTRYVSTVIAFGVRSRQAQIRLHDARMLAVGHAQCRNTEARHGGLEIRYLVSRRLTRSRERAAIPTRTYARIPLLSRDDAPAPSEARNGNILEAAGLACVGRKSTDRLGPAAEPALGAASRRSLRPKGDARRPAP